MSFSSIPSRLLLRSKCCTHQIRNYTLKSKPIRPNTLSPLQTSGLRAFHKSFTPRTVAIPKTGESPLPGLADSLARPTKAIHRSWPEISDKKVGYWLVGSAGLVFGIVVLGGLTRLTESGLSITEWKPVTGSLPPLSHDDWMDNFNKYKDSPEYRILNPNMTLDEYKFIYFMEWGHRLWGRAIGLTFVLPAIYFTARRRVTLKTALKLLGISGMIGFQGFIGWWMVKSGLRDDLFAKPGSHPRVSQYRLTAHLGAAFTVYAAMLWCGLDILRENRLLKNPADALAHVKSLSAPQIRVFRGLVGLLVAMVFTTAMTGGLVAGLDAGLIYNEFPKMGTGYMPPTKEMMDPFYSHTADGSDLWWRNLLENPTTVQFQHRVMALSTFTAIMAVFAYSRFNPRVAAAMPKKVRVGMMGVVHLASLQVLLGIGTLIYMVPTHLAATHQAGALALLTGSIVLGHRVWLPRTAARIAAQRIEAAAVKGAARRR
ncbi:cytochrome oxidase assembly protein-domain-containing protein [Tricharina praecox]|uniref:cytochrome oxidase assembly protein-domain-containing protein n=1 Tax=Tricharina praecox TaxID=43433 RepID=UPI0022208281|nr:cytochrome oxidase assembly protein-domain-containing protein [Tricharina praecox]KAI5849836.1 cytochrome oxidase assembly protein-domain-containing protein [Tricharina praecox]